MRGTAPGAPDEGEASAAFETAYVAADPKEVERQTFDAQQFDATVLCYLAAVSAGSTDGQEMADALIDITAPGGTEYAWTDLAGAIEALANGEDIDYTGASGAIDMDETGDATAGVYDTYEYKNADIEIIGETPVNTGG
jgi:branched-chain amino acid transport system substrate-binding protein